VPQKVEERRYKQNFYCATHTVDRGHIPQSDRSSVPELKQQQTITITFSNCAWKSVWNVNVVCSRPEEQAQRKLCPRTCDLCAARPSRYAWTFVSSTSLLGMSAARVNRSLRQLGKWPTKVSCERVGTAWTRSSAGLPISADLAEPMSHGRVGGRSSRTSRVAACSTRCNGAPQCRRSANVQSRVSFRSVNKYKPATLKEIFV